MLSELINHPLFLLIAMLIIMPLASGFGVWCLKRKGNLDEETLKDFGVVQAATLTLLALLIGFSFSVAVNRYDQRKDCESEEANAIGTEYLRTDLLSANNATLAREQLKKYLALRIDWYQASNEENLKRLNNDTTAIENELWQTMKNEASLSTSPVTALVIAGMNDVINTQGYTQAAWIKRFPVSAWLLLMAIAISCNILIGYGSHTRKSNKVYLFILPVMISISLALVADISSPRGGLILIQPQNLILLQQSLK